MSEATPRKRSALRRSRHVEGFGKVKTEIGKKDQNYRFACDDTWVKRVDKLETNFGEADKGTAIKDIGNRSFFP